MSPNPLKGKADRRMKRHLFPGLAYGLGAVPFGAKAQLSGLLLLFYNQLLGLPAAAVSAIIAASIVLDAVWDPLVGQISDTTRSRWGRRHPYLYGVAVPLALAFALLWRPPTGWSQPALLGWLAVFAILTRLLVSLREIPSVALMPELARGYDARTALVGLRSIFGNVGAGISFVLAFGVFLRSTPEYPFGQLNRAGYAPFGAAIAGIILVTILLSALGTHRIIPRLYVPRLGIGGIVLTLREIGQTLRSRNFAAIAAAGLLHGVNLGIHGGLAIYFSTYYLAAAGGENPLAGAAVRPGPPSCRRFCPGSGETLGQERSLRRALPRRDRPRQFAARDGPSRVDARRRQPRAIRDPPRRSGRRHVHRHERVHHRNFDGRGHRRGDATAHRQTLRGSVARRRHVFAKN